jgi:hypothetical protein
MEVQCQYIKRDGERNLPVLLGQVKRRRGAESPKSLNHLPAGYHKLRDHPTLSVKNLTFQVPRGKTAGTVTFVPSRLPLL